jgi:hypothetical protein
VSGASTLERNLLALSAGQPHLGSRLREIEPSPQVAFLTSRSGAVVPARLHEGRPIPLHSTVDPLREGRRYLDLYGQAGYLVFLGLGGGYQVLPFLSLPATSRLLIVETDAPFFRAVLERLDLRSILADPRVRLELEEDPRAIREFLLSDYLPAIHGDLRSVPLQAAIAAREQSYSRLAQAIQEVIGSVADDYTVQAHFGRRWFINTLANLPAVERSTVSVGPTTRAVVTGAGPSLEQQVRRIPELRAQGCLIASDTSLPALLAYDIVPDLVISIDCQQVSYHHFLQGIPPQVPLVLDLASPPVLTRLGARTLFFASNHPLSRLLSARWRPLPSLDASGGNVSHAAVSLALFLGAREIYLLGTDFSYPDGKAYSRGTYIYPLFRSSEHRLKPLEGQFFSFILKNSSIIKERIPGGFRYTTRPLIGYRERLERLVEGASSRVVALPGKGVPLRLHRTPGQQPGRESRFEPGSSGRLLAAGAPRCGWRAFLSWYLEGLESLPEPTAPASRYLSALPEEQQGLWATLYPAAAAFREGRRRSSREGHLLLREVRDWSIEVARRFLDR